MKTNTPATLDNLRNVPAAFTGRRVSGMLDSARAGVQSSFAVVGYKGKNWRLKYRGEENLVRDGQGRPMNDLEVVIVGIAPNVAKTFTPRPTPMETTMPPTVFRWTAFRRTVQHPRSRTQPVATAPTTSGVPASPTTASAPKPAPTAGASR